jgi:hypothetical protein
VFALKRPTKLKINIKPTKLYRFHATFLTQKDVPNVSTANPRQIPANVFALKRPTKLKINIKPTKLYRISRHVLNSKRRTKRFDRKSAADLGKCFCLKKAYQMQIQHQTNKII